MGKISQGLPWEFMLIHIELSTTRSPASRLWLRSLKTIPFPGTIYTRVEPSILVRVRRRTRYRDLHPVRKPLHVLSSLANSSNLVARTVNRPSLLQDHDQYLHNLHGNNRQPLRSLCRYHDNRSLLQSLCRYHANRWQLRCLLQYHSRNPLPIIHTQCPLSSRVSGIHYLCLKPQPLLHNLAKYHRPSPRYPMAWAIRETNLHLL